MTTACAAVPSPPSPRPRWRSILLWSGGTLAFLLLTAAAYIAWADARLEDTLAGHFSEVETLAAATPPVTVDAATLAALPDPVRRYVAFAFPHGIPPLQSVRLVQEGEFRRPGMTAFSPMTARQIGAPAARSFVFTGTVDVLPGLWAVAMDAYVDGKMRMLAKVLSAISIVDETGNAALDDLSRLRFLLEAPLFPTGLLPGPHLRWEPIDASHARMVALRDGEEIGAYQATFAEDGRLTRIQMEPRPLAGDPAEFHGAGEVAVRGDYQEVAGMMLPMRFEIARHLDGETQPFWRGRVVDVEVTMADDR